MAKRSRTPHGVRGLKFYVLICVDYWFGSHPSRGAWIEISWQTGINVTTSGRTPHGVRGLKYAVRRARPETLEVAPLTGCVD